MKALLFTLLLGFVCMAIPSSPASAGSGHEIGYVIDHDAGGFVQDNTVSIQSLAECESAKVEASITNYIEHCQLRATDVLHLESESSLVDASAGIADADNLDHYLKLYPRSGIGSIYSDFLSNLSASTLRLR